ncbi:DMT family transporter [Gynuella sunshinyii]|uniref:Putative permease, DMT superfamily n=1 Tax=Gynuella sunshinyii YC6258 TaxID=1445510 RepID=A0A0C5VSZ4_9GAMM|nr:DMT family transporter [Gynuella sunshinyii]AJQ97777.1 putative permease, DMT superfamily [Gynuella sunshinyii YC6258]
MEIHRKVVTTAGIALVSIYSIQFVAARFSLQGDISATGLTIIRFLVAGMMYLPYLVFGNGMSKFLRLGIFRILVLTVFAGFPYLYVINTGISLTSAGYVAAVGPGSIVLFSLLLSFVLLREKPDLISWTSTLAITLGIMLFVFNTFLVETISLMGTMLFILQGFMFSMYGVLIKRWGVDAILGTAVVSITSCIPALYFLVTTDTGIFQASTSELISQAIIQGVLAGAASVFLYSFIVHQLGPQRASLFMPSVPIITTLGGYYFLGETLTVIQVLGVAAMVFGMAAPGILVFWNNRIALHTTR